MTLVGPGTWEAARAAVDCAITAAELVGRTAPLTYALCRPPGHHATPAGFGGSCYLNNAAVAAAGAARWRARRSGSSTSTPTRATGPPRSSTTGPTCSTGRCTSTRAPAGSRTSSGTPRRPAPAPGAGATLNLPLPEGTGDEPWLAAVGRPRRSGSPTAAAIASSSRSAWTPRSTTRRARWRSPRTASARRARCSGRPVCRPWSVQEGGYHLPTLGGLVAAYLDGHASA